MTRIAVFVLCVFAGLATVSGQSNEWPLSPRQGVLVLRNGATLAGNITPVGDHYIVTFGNQAEVKLPIQQVERCCASLEHAYVSKRDELPEGNVTAHLALASWCLNQGMVARAADQVLMAYTIEPDYPSIASLERRLLTISRSASLSVDHTQSTSPQMAAAATEPTIESLPLGTVEQFTQRVQPVLMNRCATNACHGMRSNSEFRLLRPAQGSAIPHRYTQKNLQTTLRFVDRSQPRSSRLITVPHQPHGGLEMPVFDGRDRAQEAQLEMWVHYISGRRPQNSIAPASFEAPGGNGIRAAQLHRDIPAPMTTYGIPDSLDAISTTPQQGLDPRLQGNMSQGPSLQQQNTPVPSPANDPLDPAIFNERYTPER